MDEPTFWALVEAAKAEMTPGLSNQPEILQQKLETLPPSEIVEFDRIFVRLHDNAYRWDLWAAAYIIEGGCSDDGFTDFRAGLIGLGRDVYYAAVADPNSLVPVTPSRPATSVMVPSPRGAGQSPRGLRGTRRFTTEPHRGTRRRHFCRCHDDPCPRVACPGLGAGSL